MGDRAQCQALKFSKELRCEPRLMRPTDDPQPALLRPWGYTLALLLLGVAAGSVFGAMCSPYAYGRINSNVSLNCHRSMVVARQQVPAKPEVHQQADISEQYVPAVLSQLLVCITFHWNAGKLVYLTTVLQTLGTYRTIVDVVIVTDKAQVVSSALNGINNSRDLANVEVWQPPASLRDNTFWLTFEHRWLIQNRVQSKGYTTVMYMEDDTYISWPVLVSWALDTQVLDALNFTRCFYRTEVHHKTGRRVLLDWETRGNVTEMEWIDVTVAESSNAAYIDARGQTQGKMCGWHPSGVLQPCKDSLHRYYVSPLYPFQGMWVLTAQQLQAFMQHPYWAKNGSLHARLGRHNYWRYPERSNSINLFLHVPEGYASNCMVPVVKDPGALHKLKHTTDVVGSLIQPRLANATGDVAEQVGSSWWPQLSAVAEVRHLRNGYGSIDCLAEGPVMAKCGKWGHLATVPVQEAFIA